MEKKKETAEMGYIGGSISSFLANQRPVNPDWGRKACGGFQ